MPLVVKIILLLALLPLGTFFPGFFALRRFRASPIERISGALGLSLFFLYLVAFAIYALGLPLWLHFAVPVVGLGCAWATRDQLKAWAASRRLRRALASYGLLLLGSLALLSMVRHYSGAEWKADWQEHYQRTRFFLGELPRDFRFVEVYALPARPPLMNAVAAHFLAMFEPSFPLFQVVFLYLNSLLFFPLALFLRLFRGRGGRTPYFLLALLLFTNPAFLQNATYTWTKLLAVFYTLLALWWELAAQRRGDFRRHVAAVLALSAGMLVHYSVAPYLLALALCHALHRARRPLAGMVREGVILSLAFLLPFLTWLAWSLAAYGPRVTFGSNSTATGFAGASAGEAAHRIGLNLLYTLVPHPLTVGWRPMETHFAQASGAGFLRDYLYAMYQHNFFFGMGCVGGVIVIALLIQALRARGPWRDALLRFWLPFMLVSGLVGIAVHSTITVFGVAHICLQPLALLGVALVAARASTFPAWGKALLALGIAADAVLGVGLQFAMEARLMVIQITQQTILVRPSDDMLSPYAIQNMAEKTLAGYEFLGDAAPELLWLKALFAIAAAGALAALSLKRATPQRA